MQYLKADTAITVKFGPFLDETDGKTAETALAITQTDIRLSKNGGNFAQINQFPGSSGMTHDENGWYDMVISPTDVNTEGRLVIAVHESGALPVWREFMVVSANVFNSLFAVAGTDYLQVDTQQVEGADATDTIRDSVVDDATRIDGSAINLLTGNALGADNKILISTDGQDLSATLDVNAKLIGTDAVDADAIKADGATEIANAVLTGTTLSELAQAQPSATPSLSAAMMLLYMALRNESVTDAALLELKNDADIVICKSSLSDDGTDFTRAKLVTGP